MGKASGPGGEHPGLGPIMPRVPQRSWQLPPRGAIPKDTIRAAWTRSPAVPEGTRLAGIRLRSGCGWPGHASPALSHGGWASRLTSLGTAPAHVQRPHPWPTTWFQLVLSRRAGQRTLPMLPHGSLVQTRPAPRAHLPAPAPSVPAPQALQESTPAYQDQRSVCRPCVSASCLCSRVATATMCILEAQSEAACPGLTQLGLGRGSEGAQHTLNDCLGAVLRPPCKWLLGA